MAREKWQETPSGICDIHSLGWRGCGKPALPGSALGGSDRQVRSTLGIGSCGGTPGGEVPSHEPIQLPPSAEHFLNRVVRGYPWRRGILA